MKIESNSRVVALAALIIAIAAAIWAVGLIYKPVIRPILDVIPPFLIALVIAFLLDPVVDWLERRRFSRGFGVAIVGLSFLIVFLLVGTLVVPRVADQAASLMENSEKYSEGLQDIANKFLKSHEDLLTRFDLPLTTGEWGERYSVQFQKEKLVQGLVDLTLTGGEIQVIMIGRYWSEVYTV